MSAGSDVSQDSSIQASCESNLNVAAQSRWLKRSAAFISLSAWLRAVEKFGETRPAAALNVRD